MRLNLNRWCHTSTKLEVDSLVEISEAILSGRKDFHTDLSAVEEKGLLDILKIGNSAGGTPLRVEINPISCIRQRYASTLTYIFNTFITTKGLYF